MLKRFLLNNPFTTSMMFYPRRARMNAAALPHVHDGVVAAPDGTPLGYRLHMAENPRGLVVFFHGNAEIALDNDQLARFYTSLGLSCLLAEYRGFGWSGGHPRGSKLLPDAEAMFEAIPALCAQHDLPDTPIIVHGRSLGGAPAIHVAHCYRAQVAGLTLESTFAHVPSVLKAMGFPLFMLRRVPALFGNLEKIRELDLPLVIIHGERDSLIPIWHGEALFAASPSTQKQFVRITGGEHNSTTMVDPARYAGGLRWIVDAVV